MPRRTDVQNENRRVKYSKRLIQESLLELLQEKPLEKITVKELCEKADVNRGTFYRYYEDIFDLFHTIEDSLARDFDRHVQNMEIGSFETFIYNLLESSKKNQTLLIILANDRGDGSFFQRTIEKYYATTLPQWKPFINCNDAELRVLYTICASSLENITIDWLGGKIDMTAEELAQFVFDKFSYGVHDLILPKSTQAQS